MKASKLNGFFIMAQVVFAVDNFGGRTAWKTGRK
jgi:hypothetical protein